MRGIKSINIVFSLVWGIFLFSFWGLIYPYHFLYQEQYQLFRSSWDYFLETTSIPGGFADFVGRFISQFYIYYWLGAAIFSFLLLAIQYLLVQILKLIFEKRVDFLFPLTFIPAFCLLIFGMDEHSMLSFFIAVFISLIGSLLFCQIKDKMIRCCIGLCVFPFLFWLAGSASVIYLVFIGFYEWKYRIKNNYFLIGIYAFSIIAIILLSFISFNIVNYPFKRILLGIHYYRYPILYPSIIYITIIVLGFLPLLYAFINQEYLKKSIKWWVYVSQIVLIFGIGGTVFLNNVDIAKEEAFAYDYMARMRMWKDIIKKAQETPPSSSMAMTSVNLALGRTGQLGEKMFTFPQYNKRESLLPEYKRNMTTPLYAGEVYYHLGMINTAQRFAYETNESIPDYQKSVRCYKRLVETNIINANYRVASRYIQVLKETLFYSGWARKMEGLLYNEEAINSHYELGSLRKRKIKQEFFFSNEQQDVMLAFLLKNNSDNRLAFEYLLALKLLEKDLKGFFMYLQMCQEICSYQFLSKHFQEALAFTWSVNERDFNDLAWGIDVGVLQKMRQFALIYNQSPDDERLSEQFGDTYWYYLLCTK